MKKLAGLFALYLFGMVPGASAQFAGGSGDGYDSATLATSFPSQSINVFAGGSGDGYDSATLATSFPSQSINVFAGGSGDGYDSATSEPSGTTTRYVATDGSNAFNNCTNPAYRCATITQAVNRANPGDTLDLAAGAYSEPGLVIDKALIIQGQGVLVQ